MKKTNNKIDFNTSISLLVGFIVFGLVSCSAWEEESTRPISLVSEVTVVSDAESNSTRFRINLMERSDTHELFPFELENSESILMSLDDTEANMSLSDSGDYSGAEFDRTVGSYISTVSLVNKNVSSGFKTYKTSVEVQGKLAVYSTPITFNRFSEVLTVDWDLVTDRISDPVDFPSLTVRVKQGSCVTLDGETLEVVGEATVGDRMSVVPNVQNQLVVSGVLFENIIQDSLGLSFVEVLQCDLQSVLVAKDEHIGDLIGDQTNKIVSIDIDASFRNRNEQRHYSELISNGFMVTYTGM